MQASKRVAYGYLDGSRAGERAAWEQNLAEIIALAGTEDFYEGPAAFAEKRPPVWKAR